MQEHTQHLTLLEELDAGYVLACQSELKSDIEVEVIIKNKQE